ncbi:hypothetical protein C8J57DRAFT_1542850 [Mycena rebaudengoi]|nr:hypothetical protein C8J57DRAFT_1542850 [Mycena rebaudengoi]
MPLQPPRPAAARLRDAPGVPPSHARAPRIASYERPGAVDLARASATYVGAQGGRGRGVRRVREVPVAADVKAGGAPRLGVLFRTHNWAIPTYIPTYTLPPRLLAHARRKI